MGKHTTDSFWFDRGIQFECTQCGACCTGGPGAVFLSEEDMDRLTSYLQMEKDTFLQDYTHRVQGEISLIEKDHTDCIFLKDNRCSVHEARPTQCRTYPFWFDRMRSEEAWQQTCLECPGLGKGKTYSQEEILTIIHRDLERPRPDDEP